MVLNADKFPTLGCMRTYETLKGASSRLGGAFALYTRVKSNSQILHKMILS